MQFLPVISPTYEGKPAPPSRAPEREPSGSDFSSAIREAGAPPRERRADDISNNLSSANANREASNARGGNRPDEPIGSNPDEAPIDRSDKVPNDRRMDAADSENTATAATEPHKMGPETTDKAAHESTAPVVPNHGLLVAQDIDDHVVSSDIATAAPGPTIVSAQAPIPAAIESSANTAAASQPNLVTTAPIVPPTTVPTTNNQPSTQHTQAEQVDTGLARAPSPQAIAPAPLPSQPVDQEGSSDKVQPGENPGIKSVTDLPISPAAGPTIENADATSAKVAPMPAGENVTPATPTKTPLPEAPATTGVTTVSRELSKTGENRENQGSSIDAKAIKTVKLDGPAPTVESAASKNAVAPANAPPETAPRVTSAPLGETIRVSVADAATPVATRTTLDVGALQAPVSGATAAYGVQPIGTTQNIGTLASVQNPHLATAAQPAAQQVAVQITRAIQDGTDRISVQLKPATLGNITIDLEVGHDNRIIAVVAADRADTLDLLQRDAKALERALNDAGLKADSGSLSFNLRGDSERRGDDSGDSYGAMGAFSGPEEIDETNAQMTQANAARTIASGGVDIRI